MKVIKSLNNNMVLAFDDNGRECIYKGRKKKSFDWYKKVIATNGDDLA